LVNSFSKKFGVPGLRIGWMCASPRIIELASKLHDYMYLGVNAQYEAIAARMIGDSRVDNWLNERRNELAERAALIVATLNPASGFDWPHPPEGAMFAFPDVKGVYARMPAKYKHGKRTVGEAVADYLIHERKVAVVPGSVYGTQSTDNVRMVLCSDAITFTTALKRLKT